MSRLNLGFSAGQVDPDFGGPQGLPVGKHKVVIEAFNQKPTKANDGGILEVRLRAIEGSSAGGMKIDNLNVFNKSQIAVEIAIKRLAAYCHVVGRPDWDDSQHELEELCNIPFYISVEAQKDNPQYTEVREIIADDGAQAQAPAQQGGWGNQPAQTQTQPAQQEAQQQTQPATPSWGNQPQQQQQPATPAWGNQPAQAQTQPANNAGATPSWARK